MAITLVVEPEPVQPATELTARVVAATLDCISRAGLGKLTVDEVARASGASRATIYRTFPSKQALLAAVLGSEADRIGAVVWTAVSGAHDVDDAVTSMLHIALRELRASDALSYVRCNEPHLLDPHLEFAGGDALYARLGRRLAPFLARWCVDTERAGEWIARVGSCLLWSPAPLVDSDDADALRHFVTTFVTPGIVNPIALPTVSKEG